MQLFCAYLKKIACMSCNFVPFFYFFYFLVRYLCGVAGADLTLIYVQIFEFSASKEIRCSHTKGIVARMPSWSLPVGPRGKLGLSQFFFLPTETSSFSFDNFHFPIHTIEIECVKLSGN